MAKKPIRICSSEGCKEKYYAKGFCRKHYEQIPEVKAKKKALELTPKYKAMRKKYNNSDKRKAKQKEPESRRKQRAWQRKYDSDPKNKASAKEYYLDPKNKVKSKRKIIRDDIRLEVLQRYSKQHSKSDIPCCRCCGEKSHVDFLALDHIAGRKEMDSEPELVKLGYSSLLREKDLGYWIIENNFPKGFQILCHNCNIAKGHYGKCPHEKKFKEWKETIEKERRTASEYKAKGKERRDDRRLKILQYYSKKLSKSDIPCCRCCGENSHIEFLAIDHIAGKKEMDSERELVKLGYSSSLRSVGLQYWIIKNKFPKGFQILCHNCNYAKGIKRNKNKCPHQK